MAATCANCGGALGGRFCAACGQDGRARLTFREVAGQAIGGLLNLDSRFWRTLRDLAVPGRVTANYLAGQRARYMPPVQTYLVIALLFFAIVPIGFEAFVTNVVVRGDIERDALAAGVAPADHYATWWQRSNAPIGTEDFQVKLTRYSWLMFLTMPLFALVLQGFHLSARRDYLEHLVFTIHLQSVFFAAVAAALGVEILVRALWLPPVSAPLWYAVMALLLVYGVIACRRVYAEGWFAAGVKYSVALFAYVTIMVVAAAAVARVGRFA